MPTQKAASQSVMTDSEFDTEFTRLEAAYGDLDASEASVVARRDQAIADLCYRSGWTQTKIAARVGKPQNWVSRRLNFANLLRYATIMPDGINLTELTEGKFRGYWELTTKDAEDRVRFDEVIHHMRPGAELPTPSRPTPGRKVPVTDPIIETLARKLEAGEPISNVAIAAETGVGPKSIERRLRAAEGVVAGRKSARAETATADAAYRAELQAQLERATVAELSYRGMIDAQTKYLTRAQFMKIIWCLHPDQQPTAEQRAEAYQLVMPLETTLCGKAPAIQIMGDGTSPWEQQKAA